MIGLRGRRPLLLGLVAVLMMGGMTESTPGRVESVMCGFVNDWMSCGDPEHNARMRASMLTPAQARSIGCRPVFIAGVDVQEEDPSQEMRSYPEPTYPGRIPDPAIAARVNQAWARIEQWLGAHASASLRKLRFGAEPQFLAQWESIEGRRLPDDLYASYQRHDGADGNLGDGFQLPGSYGLLGLADLDYISSGNCRRLVLGGDLTAADPEKGQWHGTLLPIGDTGRGQELFVEPRTGRVGEAAYDEPLRYDGPMGWPSHVAMLEALAGALETGGALGEAYPTVTSGCELRWAEEPAPLPGGCAGGPRPTPAPTPEPTPEPPTAEEIRATGCRPARRDPVLRSPRWTVTAEVNATWRRIERWLARRAPKTYELLRPPARPATIAKMEAAMGATFPDDLRASLLRHDGVGFRGFGPAPFYALMSAKAIYQDWKMLCGIVLDEPELGGFWWHGRLIPFADAHDGGSLFIDPGTGRTGEYFHEDGLRPDGTATWPSYLALLKATARALETGRPIRGWRPQVTKGELDWEQAGRS